MDERRQMARRTRLILSYKDCMSIQKRSSNEVNMETDCSSICLNDLPDELLLMIFQKLTNVDVLYSFYGVNQRLTRIVRDQIFVKHLSLVKQMDKNLQHHISSTAMINRLCSDVLPSIVHEVHRLDVELSAIEDVFNAGDYSSLTSLTLHGIDEASAKFFFVDEKFKSEIIKNQLHTLELFINPENTSDQDEYSTMIFIAQNLFKIFECLNTLIINPSLHFDWVGLSFEHEQLNNFISSTLSNLKITVENFDDCYYLFDGRFPQLENVNLTLSFTPIEGFPRKPAQDSLPRMKRLTFCCENLSNQFEIRVLPLLSRMPNLEVLELCVTLYIRGTYVDEKYLQENVLSRLPRLKALSLFIQSYVPVSNDQLFLFLQQIEQNSFRFKDDGITVFYGDYFAEAQKILYYFYTSTSLNKYFYNVSNRFPGGRFVHVREVTLYDEKPFEHEFFVRIQQSFPLMEQLLIVNSKAQQCRLKDSDRLKDDHQTFSTIKYSSLRSIKLIDVHDDYIEQFLGTKTIYDRQLTLFTKYDSLKRLTNNFTTNQLRINARKVVNLILHDKFEVSSYLEEYFPEAKISGRPKVPMLMLE